MHLRPYKLRVVKGRFYGAFFIDNNEYLDALHGSKARDSIGETELNEIPLKSILDECIRQAHVQGFDWEYIT